ncbi:hypothetical protein J2848_000955 [Azospirillum lipoferum]|uniref:DUF1987 domain-containing protein n=1 Tax=Azospirillum lipoferum TaxID=193 RepID=A0A5A9GW99_AZOLI|nr:MULTISPECIES: DUF1987 domain-containing protein [Azospirillum]KAA0598670.1 DUF1987 domain-containing protein [Azospirillum lipoferum]MCP1609308.1 hypothetical protein [Azospirillum lipoferum]MDW5535382.1 DUF1987 domain-containing protein [Azospirillum sp. NL1]
MDSLTIPATGRTPGVSFDFVGGHLRMTGESYPDDVAGFFGPVFEALRGFLGRPDGGPVHFDMELLYFNSSSAKALMNIFQMLETVARSGRPVTVTWCVEENDDSMRELGEDFAEDLRHVVFRMREMPAGGAP